MKWLFEFEIKSRKCSSFSKSNSYLALKKSFDKNFNNHKFKNIDFIPAQETREDGEFIIVDDLTPIGSLFIKRNY